MVGLTLFLGGCSSRGKTKDAGWVAFFLKTGEFLHSSVSWGIALNSVLKLSNFVDTAVNTGGGENSHLPSLRNVWGDYRSVVGGALNPSSIGSSSISGEGITGRKGSLSLRKSVLLFSLSIPNSSCELSMLYTFH